ncbi:MAG: DUF1080 domain-containing protein [Halioglobus sp.]|nr:DUF1080 domain-containing protein [Halioglobus sp.]
MLMRLFVGLLVVLCCTALRAAEPVSLFDGESLDGWVAFGDIDWRVKQGAIVGAGSGDGFVTTARLYGDFYLKVEFWVDATTNSGIFLRCQDRRYIHPDTCLELNIWDEHPQQEARTGAIVFRAMPPLARVQTVGKWNTYEAWVRGKRVEVRVNGEKTAEIEDADPTAGFIALQHWASGTVKFRSVELTAL